METAATRGLHAAPGGSLTLLGLVGCLAAGCVTPGNLWSPGGGKAKEAPCNVVVRWVNEINHAPDPFHGGAATPGLLGRVYLFGEPMATPLHADGALYVELYAGAGPVAGGPPMQPAEKWHIRAEDVARLERQDIVGCGYNLFLPWPGYRPDLAEVTLRVCYLPRNGTPLWGSNTTIQLDAEAPQVSAKASHAPLTPETAAAIQQRPGLAVGQANAAPLRQTSSPPPSSTAPALQLAAPQ